MRSHLHLGHPQPAQPGEELRGDLIRAGLDHQAHVTAGGIFVCSLSFLQGGRIESVHGVEAAADVGLLVIARVSRPGAAQDKKLDLIDGVGGGDVGIEPRAYLQVGIELVLKGARRAGLIRQVALGHARVIRAEDALPRAGVGFGEHGDGGDAGKRAHGLHAQALQQGRLRLPLAARYQVVIAGDERVLGDVTALRQGVGTHGAEGFPAGADLLQHHAGKGEESRESRCGRQPIFEYFLPWGFLNLHRYNNTMKEEVRQQLIRLNSEFYETFAAAFAATRRRIQPGVRKVMEGIPKKGKWLDLGCGSGQLALEWVKQKRKGAYQGLDFSAGLLAEAEETLRGVVIPRGLKVSFTQADLAPAGWSRRIEARALRWCAGVRGAAPHPRGGAARGTDAAGTGSD